MSSLCKYSFITINKNDSSPTPTLRKTLNPCNDLLPVKFLQTANFIKRISLLGSDSVDDVFTVFSI